MVVLVVLHVDGPLAGVASFSLDLINVIFYDFDKALELTGLRCQFLEGCLVVCLYFPDSVPQLVYHPSRLC